MNVIIDNNKQKFNKTTLFLSQISFNNFSDFYRKVLDFDGEEDEVFVSSSLDEGIVNSYNILKSTEEYIIDIFRNENIKLEIYMTCYSNSDYSEEEALITMLDIKNNLLSKLEELSKADNYNFVFKNRIESSVWRCNKISKFPGMKVNIQISALDKNIFLSRNIGFR